MASAQITQTKGPTGNLIFQEQTGDTVLNISEQGGLPGFFAQGECQSDEAIKTINADGSYECNSITTQAENLSETLAAGNVANQNIDLSSNSIENTDELGFSAKSSGPDIEIGSDVSDGNPGIIIGEDTKTSLGVVASPTDTRLGGSVTIGEGAKNEQYGSVAIGGQSEAFVGSGDPLRSTVAVGSGSKAKNAAAVAVGAGASTSNTGAVALGQKASTSAGDSVAIGARAQTQATKSIAIGSASFGDNSGAVAQKKGSVAIGYEATAPNQFEATFGNLNGQESDVNVTGNLTVHGRNLTFANTASNTDTRIRNFFDQSACGPSEAVKQVYPNGTYVCTKIPEDTTAENLSETLAAGNKAYQSIEQSFTAYETLDDLSNVDFVQASSGQIYAFDNDNFVFRVLDVTDEGNISEVGDVSTGGLQDIEVVGDTVFVSDFNDGLKAIDVEDPSNPKVEDSIRNAPFASQDSTVGIDVSGNLGYAVSSPVSFDNKFGIYDISDTDDLSLVNRITINVNPTTVTVNGNYAYVGTESNGVEVFNVANPESIGSLSSVTANNPQEIEVSGGYAYVADAGSGLADTGSGLRVLDITNPGSPQQVDHFTGSATSFVEVRGDYAYIDGKVLDISSPDSVSVESDFKNANSVSIRGNVGFVSSGGSLESLKLTSIDAPSISVGSLDVGSAYIDTNLNVDRELTIGDSLFVGKGGIRSEGKISSNSNVTADNFVSRSGADLAEVYSSEEDYEPGTVVSVSSGGSDVEAASRFEDVAGVVSTDPGFTLNTGEKGVEVALEGRVPVKVAEPVEKGEDLAAGPGGLAVSCSIEGVDLNSDANTSEIVSAVNGLSKNQECLKASFGEALNRSSSGIVEVKLD
jgi:hypothetical protein